MKANLISKEKINHDNNTDSRLALRPTQIRVNYSIFNDTSVQFGKQGRTKYKIEHDHTSEEAE